jgi:hypothetical protein
MTPGGTPDRKRRESARVRFVRLFPPAAFGMLILTIALTPQISVADEGGISFWLSGTFGRTFVRPEDIGKGCVTHVSGRSFRIISAKMARRVRS